jgi:phosphopantetheine--protein transferase-like protein
MNIVTGIDAVAIDRFKDWHCFADKQLLRLFSVQEIEYARASSKKSFAQRLAVRFAAKEAFLKALQQLVPQVRLNLPAIARAVCVTKEKTGMPRLLIQWDDLALPIMLPEISSSLSLTHTDCCAYAVVLLVCADR